MSVAAQVNFKGSVQGNTLEKSSGKPLEYVNIVLLNQADSSLVKGMLTDARGKFHFQNLAKGNYFIRANFMGYRTVRSENFKIDDAHLQINLKNLLMQTSETHLEEVQITARQNVINNSIDRKVYNVEQDLMSKSGSASDILQSVPSVSVDMEGNVSLRNSGVTILINGKASPLMDKSQSVVLQQLPANSIERIEVITNPSAKYKPDGVGGIINIILKKNTRQGFNGILSANGGNDQRYNANTSLNYNPGKFNLFGSFSVRQDDRQRLLSDTRFQTNSSNEVINFQENFIGKNRPFAQIANLGLDYNFNKQISAGLSGNYFHRKMAKDENSLKQMLLSNGTVSENYNRKRLNDEYEDQSGISAYYHQRFKKEDHELKIAMNLAHSPEVEDNRYTNFYQIPAKANTLDNTLIKQTSDENQISVEYAYPLSEDSKLEAGYAGQFNKTDMDFFGENFDAQQNRFITDLQKTNRFIYHENIHAAYISFNQSFIRFGLLGGLRAEQADIRSNLVSTGQIIPNSYFKVYPTLHLSYKLKEKQELQLNYSRRVNRPEGDDLNPFAEYRDSRNLRVGNPHLQPEMIHSAELGYQIKGNRLNITPGIFYKAKYNGMTSITRALNDSTFLTTKENLSKDQSLGLEFIASMNINNLITANLSTNTFFNQIDASNLGYSNKKSTVSWNATLSSNYSISKSSMLQVNAIYRSARLSPQGRFYPSFVLRTGYKQDILKNKASLYLTISDLLKSLRQETLLNTTGFSQHQIMENNSRVVYLGFTYHIGKKSKKKDTFQYDNGN
ncbi:MAG TPA: TonB-dependent receptor [Daejeonella sp.]|nr:TonB-dependent receptor [Daejeonella sp.]